MRRHRAQHAGILLFAITIAFTQAAVAEIYKWVDAQGNIHYGVPVYHYLTGEDGKPVSSERQREIVKELEIQYAAAGCN